MNVFKTSVTYITYRTFAHPIQTRNYSNSLIQILNVYSERISDLSNGVFTDEIGIPDKANIKGTHYLKIISMYKME